LANGQVSKSTWPVNTLEITRTCWMETLRAMGGFRTNHYPEQEPTQPRDGNTSRVVSGWVLGTSVKGTCSELDGGGGPFITVQTPEVGGGKKGHFVNIWDGEETYIQSCWEGLALCKKMCKEISRPGIGRHCWGTLVATKPATEDPPRNPPGISTMPRNRTERRSKPGHGAKLVVGGLTGLAITYSFESQKRRGR